MTTEVRGVGRRRLGTGWLIGAIAVPTVAVAVATAVSQPTIESHLESRSRAALESAGFDVVSVDFTGRDGVVDVATGDKGQAREIVARQPGVRVAHLAQSVLPSTQQVNAKVTHTVTLTATASASQTASPTSLAPSPAAAASASATSPAAPTPVAPAPTPVAPAPTESAPPADSPTPVKPMNRLAGLHLERRTEGVVIRAQVPDEAQKSALLSALAPPIQGAPLIDEITVNAQAPSLDHGLIVQLAQVVAAPGPTVTEFVARSSAPDAAEPFLELTGKADTEQVKNDVAARMTSIDGMNIPIRNNLTIVARPNQPAAPTNAGPDAGPTAGDCGKVNEDVKNILQNQQIRFALSGTRIAASSQPTLQTLADRLKPCVAPAVPSAQVTVEGHASADGVKEVNLRLSQQRAEAVREALIQKGLAADSLIALGLGDQRPIAPNETDAGRAQNRRVEIIVQERQP